MNRLELAIVPSSGRSVALAALVATTSLIANAQSNSTPTPSYLGFSQPTTQQSPLTSPTSAQTQAQINQTQSQIANHDYAGAVDSYRQLSQSAKLFPAMQPQVAKLHQQLTQLGIDGSLLALPPRTTDIASKQPLASLPDAIRLPPVGNAKLPASAGLAGDPAARKAEALRLVAIGRAALERGDVSAALTAGRQAQALNVPEREFRSGEPRVWQLMLDAESSARRSGIAQVSAESPVGTPGFSPIARAGFESDTAQVGNQVSQSVFNPGATPNGQVQQVQATAPAATPSVTVASQAYESAMQALTSGNRAEARKKFAEAWKYKEGLTATQRNQVQDKLTLLQPKRLVPSGGKPSGQLTQIEKTQLESEAATRRLYREVTSELANAEKLKGETPLDALDNLERLRRRVDGSSVDERAKRSLVVLVDRAIKDQKSYIDANKAKINLDIQNDSVRTELAQAAARDAAADEEISTLVDRFNDLVTQSRFEEAEQIAKQVSVIKPGSTIAITMTHRSRVGIRKKINEEIQAEKEASFVRNMQDAERSFIGPDPNLPLTLPDAETWSNISRLRLGQDEGDSSLSPAEREIQSRLSSLPVNIQYVNRPLAEVINDLQAVTNIPMVMDQLALKATEVTPDAPVTLNVSNAIPLKSALNLILDPLQLAYVIDNDVLNITSREVKESNVRTQVYRVTDLVTPIPNFTSSNDSGLVGALRAAYQMTRGQAEVQYVPVSATGINNAANFGAGTQTPFGNGSSVLGQFNPLASSSSFGPPPSPFAGGSGGGSSFADFTSLIDLITSTIDPETWDALGGPSTIREYPQNLSLVISTTSETHDDIAALLESLRRLQNLQITIEVRFITLSDTFAEQIGVDFDFQVDDNTTSLPDEDSGESVTIGFNGQGFTPDLDISFNNTSFLAAAPAFGGANLGDASSLGFAVLSDIEAFFFIQAIQTDNRTNVMQAPKVTLFDGQFATINDQVQQPFVTGVTPVVGDFAVAQQPIIVVLNEGTSLNVQGVVSDDKRFVRLTLVPLFTQIGDVNTFTFEGGSTSTSSSQDQEDTNGDGVVDGQDANDTEAATTTVGGTTVQLPQFANTQVQTTVSVPDGGTILLGGIKRLSESRAERGVPVLSKIPYISRLFRNVTVGRDAQSLMLMVTPRIIIQEEEELAQTGFDPNNR